MSGERAPGSAISASDNLTMDVILEKWCFSSLVVSIIFQSSNRDVTTSFNCNLI